MPEVWSYLKRAISCKALPDVLDAKDCNHPNCGGSRSTQNLKDGSKQLVEKPSVGKSHASSTLVGHKCDGGLEKSEAVEAHNLSKPAVTKLADGEESRKVVEIICGTSSKSKENFVGIEKVLKVHNIPEILAQFEEYREIVKVRAGSKLSETHPRRLADGNELLRFYGTTVACSIGMNGSSSLCTFDKCGVCQTLTHGFSTNKEIHNGEMGVFTTSTCEKAIESIELQEINKSVRKAVIVCRVIAGRILNKLEMLQDMEGNESGFDSLAGELGPSCNFEELYLLNPKSILPCFVVILNASTI